MSEQMLSNTGVWILVLCLLLKSSCASFFFLFFFLTCPVMHGLMLRFVKVHTQKKTESNSANSLWMGAMCTQPSENEGKGTGGSQVGEKLWVSHIQGHLDRNNYQVSWNRSWEAVSLSLLPPAWKLRALSSKPAFKVLKSTQEQEEPSSAGPQKVL
jgi:hypothetical protein